MKEKDNTNRMRKMLIDSNRRLQETAQKLFMAKQELEKKNKELEIARFREKQQKEELERELKGLKHLVSVKAESFKTVPEKKLTRSIAKDLSLKYIQLLRTYLKTKDLDKEEPLTEELCQKLIEYSVTPKGIIDLHLKSTPQVETIGGLETKRIIFEVRMVLLAVMTKYASLLRRKVIKK
jgi:hypothetical protein